MSQQQIASSGAPADGSGTLRLLRIIARGLRGRARGFVRRQREFAKDCLFVLLPAKLRFQLGLLFRHLTRRSDLDAHMEFFCGRRMGDLSGWIENNRVSRRCPSELFLYYIFTGDQKRALVQFVKVDWSMLDDQSAEIVDRLAGPIIGGYAADLLAQLHIVGWSQMPARIRDSFAELVTLMLEHRNFGYEERMFVGRAERDPRSLAP